MAHPAVRPPDVQHMPVRPAVNRIEFLYFESCPGHADALRMLKDVLRTERIVAEIRMQRVESDQEARMSRFPGSPTIRVNGRDIEDSPDLVVGLSCRVYRGSDGRVTALPPRDKLLQALRRSTASTPAMDYSKGMVGPTRHG